MTVVGSTQDNKKKSRPKKVRKTKEEVSELTVVWFRRNVALGQATVNEKSFATGPHSHQRPAWHSAAACCQRGSRQRCYPSMGYTMLAHWPPRRERVFLNVHLSSRGGSSCITDEVLIYRRVRGTFPTACVRPTSVFRHAKTFHSLLQWFRQTPSKTVLTSDLCFSTVENRKKLEKWRFQELATRTAFVLSQLIHNKLPLYQTNILDIRCQNRLFGKAAKFYSNLFIK